MQKEQDKIKRFNKTIQLDQAMQKVIAPFLQKRGFASRDLIKQWANIVPSPYDRVTIPDRLAWPRGAKSANGAILYLRCKEAHKVALSYDSEIIIAAINRYFGYILVEKIKISLSPFSYYSDEKIYSKKKITNKARKKIDNIVGKVENEKLKQALQNLGENISGKSD